MITSGDIKKKLLKIWDSGRFLSAWCIGENIFPVEIPAGSVKGGYISENFQMVSRWIDELVSHSKQRLGAGYSIEYTQVSHRQLGKQKIPRMIIVENAEDFLFISGKDKEYEIFKKVFAATETTLAAAVPYIRENPLTVLSCADDWERILKVCRFFIDNPEPSIYLRQIVITGVNTKFIERNKRIISSLLIFLMPAEYGTEPAELSGRGFEKRFGLRYDEPLIRFRILDPDLYINSLADITLTLSEFASLEMPAEKIFITENKINGLAFPDVKNSIIIFGFGYGIVILKEIQWIKNRIIYYWGDIDTHGFSILSMVRSFLPQCRSFLMDECILLNHRISWVEEDDEKRFTGDLPRLNESENALFVKLKKNVIAGNVRLEQELVSYESVLNFLSEIE